MRATAAAVEDPRGSEKVAGRSAPWGGKEGPDARHPAPRPSLPTGRTDAYAGTSCDRRAEGMRTTDAEVGKGDESDGMAVRFACGPWPARLVGPDAYGSSNEGYAMVSLNPRAIHRPEPPKEAGSHRTWLPWRSSNRSETDRKTARETDPSQTQELIRKAHAEEMYGNEPASDPPCLIIDSNILIAIGCKEAGRHAWRMRDLSVTRGEDFNSSRRRASSVNACTSWLRK